MSVFRGLNTFSSAQYINIGTGGADMGSLFFLPKLVGWGRAAEMCMTGERVPAAEAYRIGLANHVHTREDLLPAAKTMATVMCTKNNLGLRLTKDAFNAALNGSQDYYSRNLMGVRAPLRHHHAAYATSKLFLATSLKSC